MPLCLRRCHRWIHLVAFYVVLTSSSPESRQTTIASFFPQTGHAALHRISSSVSLSAVPSVTSRSQVCSSDPHPPFGLFATVVCRRHYHTFFSASGCRCATAPIILRSPHPSRCDPLTIGVSMLAFVSSRHHLVAIAAASPSLFPTVVAIVAISLPPLPCRLYPSIARALGFYFPFAVTPCASAAHPFPYFSSL